MPLPTLIGPTVDAEGRRRETGIADVELRDARSATG